MLRQAFGSLTLVCSATLAAAQDFGIESKVFDGRELVATSTTLLAGDRAYDFLVRPDETIILALDAGTIDLLDNARKIRARVTAEELTSFNDALRHKAERSGSEAMRFYAAPTFREELDPETREIVLTSPWLEYRAKPTSPPNADVLRRYEKYVSRQARLNTLVNPGSPPALPRLELNAALARRQVLAEKVSMRRTSDSSGVATSLQAEHRFTWRLDEPDRRRIEEAEQRLATYRLVSVDEYVRALVESARR